MIEVEGMSAAFKKAEDDLKTIRQILKVVVSSYRFNGDEDYKFVIEALTMAEEFFSGVLYNGKSFDADSYVKIVKFTRILTNEIFSSHNFLDEMILISKRESNKTIWAELD